MKKFVVLLALLMALMVPGVLAEEWEHEEPDYIEVAMYEGERISVDGYLRAETRERDFWYGNETIYCLYLDQPIDFTMLRYDGYSAAQLDWMQIVTDQDLTQLLDKRVSVEGVTAFADDTNDLYIAVAVANADVSLLVDEDAFFVPAPDLYEGAASDVRVVKLEGDSYLRKEPNRTGKSMGVLKKGEYVTWFGSKELDERGVAWYDVYHETLGTGWVSSKYTKIVSGTEAQIRIGYVYADGGKSNLRKAPNLNGKIIATFNKGDTAVYMGEDSWDERGVQWYKISYKGNTGWVSSKYTSLIYPQAPWYEDWNVQARGGDAYVRTGPGLNYGICGLVKKGEELPHLGDTYYDDRGVAWYSVSVKSGKGWVSSRYSKLVEE